MDFSRKLNYGAVPGSVDLRTNISNLYKTNADVPVPADNILVTQGGIAANFLLLYTLIGPGDHVICVYPTYQQLYEVPKALGAEVSLWKLTEENQYILDFQSLEGLTKPNTKLIIIKCVSFLFLSIIANHNIAIRTTQQDHQRHGKFLNG